MKLNETQNTLNIYVKLYKILKELFCSSGKQVYQSRYNFRARLDIG